MNTIAHLIANIYMYGYLSWWCTYYMYKYKCLNYYFNYVLNQNVIYIVSFVTHSHGSCHWYILCVSYIKLGDKRSICTTYLKIVIIWCWKNDLHEKRFHVVSILVLINWDYQVLKKTPMYYIGASFWVPGITL